VAIHTLLDVDQLMLENLTGRLKAKEEELDAPPPSVNHAGKLYLSKEAWEEKWKARDRKKPTGSSLSGRGYGRRGGHSSRGRRNGGSSDSNGSLSNGPAQLGKNHCFKNGHWALNDLASRRRRRPMWPRRRPL
jgi:hypothetical protein